MEPVPTPLILSTPSALDTYEKASIIKHTNNGLLDQLYGSLSSNPYFSAGAGLIGIGAVATVSRRAIVVVNTLFRRRFISTLELENTDSAYPWVLDYINKQASNQTNKLTANTWLNQTESGRVSTSFCFLPSRGVHYFWFGCRLIKVERNRENQSVQKQGVRTPLETVTLTTFQGNANYWKEFLNNASREAVSQIETGLVIYNAIGPEWHRFGKPRNKRPLSSIILDQGVGESLEKDFKEFQSSQKWYYERGIPYRRGYLFYGPPGTGKSSYISALAGHYGYSICMLSLSERTLDDDRLNHLLNIAPSNSFIVLEDVDAAMPTASRELLNNMQHKAYEGLTRVTLSGLLNAIDGVASSEDRILFLTTNHVDRLDKALIRPGRVDFKQYFGNCTKEMLFMMFKRFYKNISDKLCDEFANKAIALNTEFSPAQIQGHLLVYKVNPQKAIQELDKLLQKLC